ncbi:MAG: class I SAM-dependent methyltransferase [Erysipelotrichaceae bacterium]|nr:class I SAM-dependent methyltransferase [Erysipelotrichaceae bacterium]
MKLSQRLQAIADIIIQQQKGHILADIGSDHAYLPVYLVLNNIIDKAYACDIASGPLNAAIETIDTYHVERKVKPLQGSGLNPIIDKNVDMISICGMGGKLTVEILDEFPEYLNHHRFILQVNVGLEILREYLYKHQMKIIAEDIVKDASHIYEIIVCEKTDELLTYNEQDFYFGPILRQNKNDLFKEKWLRQLKIYQNILTSLTPSQPRYQEVTHMIAMIEEEIY